MKRLTLALILVLSAPVHAEMESQSILDKINPAWLRLDTLSQGFLTDVQQQTLQELAFASAVGEICEGFRVDEKQFVGAFDSFADKANAAMPAEDRLQRERKILVLYGIATGLFSAEGLLAKKDFCAAADSVRKKPAGRFWAP